MRGEAVSAILPIIDNLERALGAADADGETMRKGVEMVLGQTLAIFERMEVKAFGEVGDAFDPNFHNCVGTIETAFINFLSCRIYLRLPLLRL